MLTQVPQDLVWEPLSPFVQDTKGLVSRTFESLQLESGRLDYVAPRVFFVPKISIWDDYPRYLEDETDSEGSDSDFEDFDEESSSSTDQGTSSVAYNSSEASQCDDASEPPSSSYGSPDYGGVTNSVYDDDDDEDDEYAPPIHGAFNSYPQSIPALSCQKIVPRSKAEVDTQSAPCSLKRKYQEFKEATDDEGSSGEQYKVVRDYSGKVFYQCRKCPDFCTKASGDMKRHLESLAHKPPSYHCPQPGCGAAFTRKDALKRHMLKARQHGAAGKKVRSTSRGV